MAVSKKIRQNPFICFLITFGNVLTGRLHFSQKYIGKTLNVDDRQAFTIFRHMTLDADTSHSEAASAVFIVRFKFATLSQKANRFGRRGFFHRGCWLNPIITAGTKIGRVLHLPDLHVRINNAENFIDCKLCTKKCPMSIDVYERSGI